ncbi:hypothetical protein SNOG_11737 [Parastagonospora nodorum SN15]|uniref:Erythromycin esterase n=1 Tax=Phaeosphaeria nodorum (strain SN15 / ATCC MYA-4574 / FGSC 10173) TaxID=321614 RepID=Q0U927_PHANO|nr:hypothetical protein SNOG_11737 [Parastagonospora nodorum SN15]EAT80781.2 hypothetical protein SNOG_11737 [Parastagonospora nodorum SN15]
MARRSARLQKPTPTPTADTSARSRSSDDSWMTADSSPHTGLPVLPEMPDLPDPSSVKTPQKAAAPASRLPHATATPAALKSKSSKSLLSTKGSQTPTNRTPIKPAGQEMHPAHHHASTAKVLDEARWLGFQALGAHTAPPKAAGMNQATPSKTPVPASAANAARIESSPDFRFRFKSPFAGFTKSYRQEDATLSPGTRNLLKDSARRPEPKGKIARFSDVHMQQFKKMDSIANHASAFRADPTRFKPVVSQPLKKSPSKPELAKPETSKLKRTQSKMDLTDSGSKIPPTPLKRTQSKMDLAGSSLPRSQSTVRLVASASASRPMSRDGPVESNQTAKRIKRTEADDAATTRPTTRDAMSGPSAPPAPTPARKITSQTALPRLAARLMTPTKASMARSQSVKTLKTTSMIPSLAKSPSTNNLFSPTNVAQSMRDGARCKYSDDPVQIAAGTHMSPPMSLNLEKALPPMPATAPVKKHVIFTNSTLQRAGDDDLGKSPSPMKFRAGSEVPSGAVIYPTLSSVQYPEISQEAESPSTSPSRRLTFGEATANQSRSFSFESGKAVDFGPSSAGTIRMVRKSDASTLVEGKKRKLDTVQETSDKENDTPADDSYRSAKKMKPMPATPSKTPAGSSKVARKTPSRGSAISKSRLAFLATPKRGKA